MLLSHSARRWRRIGRFLGQTLLFLITSGSIFAVLFIFYFIGRDAIPFFRSEYVVEFFTSTKWLPSADEPSFGALAIFYGTAMVTIGSIIVAVPLGVSASLCLSDILPFSIRQVIKPVIEMLAAIPSVAYGFFALIVLAPLLQDRGGTILAITFWVVCGPPALLALIVVTDVLGGLFPKKRRVLARLLLGAGFIIVGFTLFFMIGGWIGRLTILTGTNALNASLILGIMALPTIVSVSEDALQAVGRDLREGSYALGATRAETLMKVVIPAAMSGITAAIILGVMRAIGETMVVWMAAGNATHIPTPWYDLLAAVRTLTASIAGDMGEADQSLGSMRYHVLFAMAFALLVISFVLNMLSEWAVHRSRKKLLGK